MKLDKVRTALAAILPQGQEETARERSVRLVLVQLNRRLVTAFEEVVIAKKDKCNVDVVRVALVYAAREMFVLYGVGKIVPETPSGQGWLSF